MYTDKEGKIYGIKDTNHGKPCLHSINKTERLDRNFTLAEIFY